MTTDTESSQWYESKTWPTLIATNDYYLSAYEVLHRMSFGMAMSGRTSQLAETNAYRYGFNGKEKDVEGMGGGGSTYDYGFRIYNPRIAKFLSVDPLAASFAWNSPYSYAENDVVRAIDLDGLEKHIESDKMSKYRAPIVRVINSSKILSGIIKSISDEEKAEKISIYYTSLPTTSNARGVTFDMIDWANKYYVAKAINDADGTGAYELYKYSIAFLDLGITNPKNYKEREINEGRKSFGIALRPDLLEGTGNDDIKLAQTVFTVFHEIEAHLKDYLDNGNTSTTVEDHIKFFGLDKSENEELYKKYKSSINAGNSIPYEEIPDNSPAGRLKNEIEDTIKNMTNE